MVPHRRPQIKLLQNVGWRTIQCFTAIQVASTVLIFGIAQFADWGYVFPALVCACVPLRERVVSRVTLPLQTSNMSIHSGKQKTIMKYTTGILPGRQDFHAAGILMPSEPSPSNPDKEGMSTL